MAFQSQNLVMIGLGVNDENPQNEMQPQLPNGIHLRWAFYRDIGFPWYGYYLFRREHKGGNLVSISQFTSIELTSSNKILSNSEVLPGIELDNTIILKFKEDDETDPDAPYSSTLTLYADEKIIPRTNLPPESTPNVGFDMLETGNQKFEFEYKKPVRKVSVKLGFRKSCTIKISTALTLGPEIDAEPLKIPLAEQIVEGNEGEIKTVEIEYDAISEIIIESGPVSLYDFAFVPVEQEAHLDWDAIPKGGTVPISLPVANADYPCITRPGTFKKARELAFNRVTYSDPPINFSGLHNLLKKLVIGGSETAMSVRNEAVVGEPSPADSKMNTPAMPNQYPLDLVLLSSLNPSIAQMLGLYYVDKYNIQGSTEISSDKSYDYLIIADHNADLDLNKKAEWLPNIANLAGTDAWITFNHKIPVVTEILPKPENLFAYMLPGGTIRKQGDEFKELQKYQEAAYNVGLLWKREIYDDKLLSKQPIMFHIWRADLGLNEPTAEDVANADFKQLTKTPYLLTPPTDKPKTYSPDWPQFSMYYYDIGQKEGWYSYKICGIDIFGRYTPMSDVVKWKQWTIESEEKQPWYYHQPPDDSVHDYAIHLLDKIPPPSPAAVEATLLDPNDRYMQKDAAFFNWYNNLSDTEKHTTVIALRIRWQWTYLQRRQAPDTKEFRVYFHSGLLNALTGKISEVTASGNDASWVVTDIDVTNLELKNNTFKDEYLRVGTRSFRILGSKTVSPLKIKVKNIGSDNLTAPKKNSKCTVVISQDNPLYLNYSKAPLWDKRIAVVDYDDTTHSRSMIVPALTSGNEQLTSKALKIDASVKMNDDSEWELSFPIYSQPDLSRINLRVDFLYLEEDTSSRKLYPIKRIDTRSTDVGGGKTINETVLIIDGEPNIITNPTPWKIGVPVRQYELFLPLTQEDCQNYGLEPSLEQPAIYAHIGVSAVDDKTHTADHRTEGLLSNRTGNESRVAGPAKIFRILRQIPKTPVLPPDSEKVYASPPDYNGHSFYTFRWKPENLLKTHIFRALDDTLFKIDQANKPWLQFEDKSEFFPEEMNDREDTVLTELNEFYTVQPDEELCYDNLSNDALRVLAGLPGNEKAFSQITIQPFDSDETEYVDTLNGRATNRYFYRAAYVDSVGNISKLSLSSAPVYLPDMLAPTKPRFHKVTGGDRQISLTWAGHTESNMKRYLVYRTENKADGRDIRLMGEPVAEIDVDADTAAAEHVWIDNGIVGAHTYFYRIIAIREGMNGNGPLLLRSEPSELVAGRGFDNFCPMPPEWNEPEINADTGTINLSWYSNLENLRCMVQQSPIDSEDWKNLSGWLPRGEYLYSLALHAENYQYRLKVMDERGRMNKDYNVLNIGGDGQ